LSACFIIKIESHTAQFWTKDRQLLIENAKRAPMASHDENDEKSGASRGDRPRSANLRGLGSCN